MRKQLSYVHFEEASWKLDCSVPAIRAVASVESNGRGFLPDGQVAILFEGHVFSRLTGGKFDRTHPTISYPKWTKKHYLGPLGEHGRLQKAVELDRDAALMSASWGMFQIMGFNYGRCNFSGIQPFVNYVSRGEPQQLDLFVRFIKSSPGLLSAIRTADFTKFARLYNGSGYAQNGYHTKMRQAYLDFGGK